MSGRVCPNVFHGGKQTLSKSPPTPHPRLVRIVSLTFQLFSCTCAPPFRRFHPLLACVPLSYLPRGAFSSTHTLLAFLSPPSSHITKANQPCLLFSHHNVGVFLYHTFPSCADVFRAVGRQYRHILVDEWQDTNGPQYDLVLELSRAGVEAQFAREDAWRAADAAIEAARLGDKAVAGGGAGGEAPASASVDDQATVLSPPPQPLAPMPPPSIFVVGDSDQCIYRFRGADYTNVARFVEDFQGCQTILLRENYRSTANIARAATSVIEKVQERIKQPTVAVQVSRFVSSGGEGFEF